MGLCKCPKRRVTNQFCFEHRVNVCEHCMVTNHPKCIVQSYLQWLQDSDYNPICELCMKDLKAEDCIRLACYHVYHWACLDRLARELPTTTAPAGYTCPSCRSSLFPASNLVSPVADVLREKLAGVNWARAGLGLPLLAEEREQKPSDAASHSVVTVEEAQVTYSRGAESNRRTTQSPGDMPPRSLVDHDEDKYKRRPGGELLRRWWANAGLGRRAPATRRYCMSALLVLAALFMLAMLLSRLARHANDNDPLFDPINNPHIKVQHVVDSR